MSSTGGRSEDRVRTRVGDDRVTGRRLADGHPSRPRRHRPSPRSAAPSQVYVTGLAPFDADVARQQRRDTVVQTQKANSLGGLLFRNVPPATGYRVRRVSDGLQSATHHGALRAGRRRGIRRSTTSRFPTTATRTSPPVTGRSSPSTCTRRRARRASPACRRACPLPNGPDFTAAVPDADRVLGLRVRQPGRSGRAASRCSRT